MAPPEHPVLVLDNGPTPSPVTFASPAFAGQQKRARAHSRFLDPDAWMPSHFTPVFSNGSPIHTFITQSNRWGRHQARLFDRCGSEVGG